MLWFDFLCALIHCIQTSCHPMAEPRLLQALDELADHPHNSLRYPDSLLASTTWWTAAASCCRHSFKVAQTVRLPFASTLSYALLCLIWQLDHADLLQQLASALQIFTIPSGCMLNIAVAWLLMHGLCQVKWRSPCSLNVTSCHTFLEPDKESLQH